MGARGMSCPSPWFSANRSPTEPSCPLAASGGMTSTARTKAARSARKARSRNRPPRRLTRAMLPRCLARDRRLSACGLGEALVLNRSGRADAAPHLIGESPCHDATDGQVREGDRGLLRQLVRIGGGLSRKKQVLRHLAQQLYSAAPGPVGIYLVDCPQRASVAEVAALRHVTLLSRSEGPGAAESGPPLSHVRCSLPLAPARRRSGQRRPCAHPVARQTSNGGRAAGVEPSRPPWQRRARGRRSRPHRGSSRRS